MQHLSELVSTLSEFNHTQQMWFLAVMIIAGFIAVIGIHGYWLYLRYATRDTRQQALAAHENVLLLSRLIKEAESHFRESQAALSAIDKALNSLSVVGPEKVGMLLADIRLNVGRCLDEIEAVRALVKGHKANE